MQKDVDQLVSRLRPKIKSMLRVKGTYGMSDMILQYKTHIWGHVEHHCGVLLHASNTVLNKLDTLQSRFLRDLDISPEAAFLDYNFAPTMLRRDLGILGFIHKRILDQCHIGVALLLPRRERPTNLHHDKQISIPRPTHRLQLFNKSLFALVQAYNMLPQWIVNATSVPQFQKHITILVRRRCAALDDEWPFSCHSCEQIWKLRAWQDE